MKLMRLHVHYPDGIVSYGIGDSTIGLGEASPIKLITSCKASDGKDYFILELENGEQIWITGAICDLYHSAD